MVFQWIRAVLVAIVAPVSLSSLALSPTCDAMWGSCAQGTPTDTCRSHLLWAINHEHHDCEGAVAEIIGQCDACAGCSASDCTAPRPEPKPPTPARSGFLPECSPDLQGQLQSIVSRWAKRMGGKAVSAGVSGKMRNGEECTMNAVDFGYGAADGTQQFFFGSFTKIWTAGAVMKLYQDGQLDIDTPAYPILQPVYNSATGGKLEDRFGENIKVVTTRQLLSMRGGINEYDELTWQLQSANLKKDIGPEESAELFGGSSGAEPGTCGSYSSMSYVLLGMILIGKSGKTWDTVDLNPWRDIFPHVDFSIHGTCSEYVPFQMHCLQCSNAGVDLKDMSCTNGYTSGNIFARTDDAARYLRLLFTNQLLSPSVVEEMKEFKPLGDPGSSDGSACGSWAPGTLYGLGIQAPANGINVNGDESTRYLGHTGAGYGCGSLNAYDSKSELAISATGAYDGGTAPIWYDIHNALASIPMNMVVV